MAVGDSVLLLLSVNQRRERLIRLIEVEAEAFVLPIRWILANKLNEARMLDQNLNLFTVEKISIVGIPDPRTLMKRGFNPSGLPAATEAHLQCIFIGNGQFRCD